MDKNTEVSISSLKKEIKEMKEMLVKQNVQNKRLMMLSFLNVYFVLAALVFITMFK